MNINNFDKNDLCLQVSLYCSGRILSGEYNETDNDLMEAMIYECNLNSILWPRKNAQYSWSNSGSENPAENTLFKRPTKWIYDHIFAPLNSKFGWSIDLHKGLNTDQLRAFFIYLWLMKYDKSKKIIAKKILLGLFCRMGMLPSLMENAIFKPHNFILLFDIFLMTKPIFYITKKLFAYSISNELNIDIRTSSTNKISLLPTMKLLGYQMPSSVYVQQVYSTYFPVSSEQFFIGETLIKGVLK